MSISWLVRIGGKRDARTILAMEKMFRSMTGALLLAAASVAQANEAQAAERCEKAVAETVQRLRGRDARDVEFTPARRALSPPAGDEISVRGEGHDRGRGGGPVAFTFSCAFNTSTAETSGVVFREAATTAAAAEAAWHPDLSRISPEACESAVAGVLKSKHPRVEGIVFGSQTRRLDPADNTRLGMQGQGALRRAPGMNAVPFSYRCEYDPRTGQVIAAQASD